MKKLLTLLLLVPTLAFATDKELCADEPDPAACVRFLQAERAADHRLPPVVYTEEDFARNQIARCLNLPGWQVSRCMKRIKYGAQSGSVEGGGILYELREIVRGDPDK